jgi:hypothetical protein
LSLERRRAREDRTLEQVWELVEPYAPRGVSDQHQSDAIISFFGRRGASVRVVNLTGPVQTQAFTSTRTRLVDGSLRCWRQPLLLEELRRVRAKSAMEGIDLPRFGGGHCDAASALALATFEHRGVSDSPPPQMIPHTGRTITGDLGALLDGRPVAPRRDPDRRTFSSPPPGWSGRRSIMNEEF